MKDNYLDANINLGIEHKKLNKFKSAKEYFEKANILSPNNHLIYNNMGNLCKDLEDLEGARKLYDKSIEIKKDNIHIIIKQKFFCYKNLIAQLLILKRY